MLTREQIVQRLREERPYLAAEFGVGKIGLFGSYAEDQANQASDIDLVVEFERPIGFRFFELADHLESILGRQVDVLTPAGIQGIRVRQVAQNIRVGRSTSGGQAVMVPQQSPSQADIDAVRAVEAAYDAAWTSGDLVSLLRCFADDAVLVNPRGEVAVWLEQIRERLGAFLQGEAKGSRHASRITRISFVTADVAVVDGEAHLQGGAEWSMVHRYTDVVVRRDGRWLLAHVRAYALEKT